MTRVLTMPYRRGAETKTLSLGEATGGWTSVEPYDFREYEARYRQSPPEPRYVLSTRRATGDDPLSIEVEYAYGGTNGSLRIAIPHGAAAGTSFAIPTPHGADATLRLLRLRCVPAVGDESLAASWSVVALLGNISKLAWVLGWEKDRIRQEVRAVARQRLLEEASGGSLDRIGDDLRVPRFPARAYSFDADTVALYHFNESPSDGQTVIDAMTGFGRAGHPGTVIGTLRSAMGKFGNALRFGGPPAGAVVIPNHADFNFAAGQDFTVEAFVKPDGVADLSAPAPRTIISKSAEETSADGGGAGWTLDIGSFRGIANNVRCLITDGGEHSLELFADVNIADGRFHHVACVIDRARDKARLLLDGEERAAASLEGLGAVVNAEDVRIGGAHASRFSGVVDEVRFSRRARESFHPALGEGDEEYRRRLGVFAQWFVPSPVALAEAINRLVKINNVSPSFLIDEEDKEMILTHKKVRIIPRDLQRGATISADGNPRTTEAKAAGIPQDEPEFDAAWLVAHDSDRVAYGNQPHTNLMQRGAAQALDRLLERLQRLHPNAPGKLSIQRAYDPTASDLHRVGRSLLISHPALELKPGKLAVHAHAAGFDYVSHERNGLLKVSVRKSEPLEIVFSPEVSPTRVLREGEAYQLGIHPAPPAGASVRWAIVRGGHGDAEVQVSDEGATFRALVAGLVLLRVEVTLNHQTVTGSRHLRIGIPALAAGDSIGGDGRRGTNEREASGGRSELFHEEYLLTHDDQRLDYGTNPQNRRMQLGLARALERLLPLLPDGGKLRVEQSYVPGAEDLHGEGRALRLTHSTLTPSELAPHAFAAGFDFIKHLNAPASLHVSVAQSDMIHIGGPDEVAVEEQVELRLEPEALPLGGESGHSVTWAALPLPRGRVEIPPAGAASANDRRSIEVVGREPGTVAVRAMYLRAGKTDPYQFELRLAPELEESGAIIGKDQYDIIMNLLNSFHPVGVKVLTEKIRRHVVEVREGQLDAFPGYTYPKL